MAKLTLNTIGSRYGSIDALNANFDAIETALENTLSRDGTAPNGMDANFDMDSQRIINLANGINNADAVNLGQVNNIVNGASSGIIASLRENFVATAGQTVFNISSFTYNVGSNNLAVYLDGVRQYPGTSYTETDNNTITFSAGLHVGALVMVISNQSVDTANLQASAVHYTPAGTGAVNTNVQAKLRQTVSVKDFGAVGNGVIDDTAAIQAAITYIYSFANAGGTGTAPALYFPTGTYLMSSTITMGNTGYQYTLSPYFYGDANGTVIKVNAANVNPFYWRGPTLGQPGAGNQAAAPTIENMTFVGPGRDTGGTNTNSIALNFNTVQGVRLINTVCKNWNTGENYRDTDVIYRLNASCDYNYIGINSSSLNNLIRPDRLLCLGGTITHNTAYGIFYMGGQTPSFNDVFFNSNGTSLMLSRQLASENVYPTVGPVIQGCYFEADTNYTMQFGGGSGIVRDMCIFGGAVAGNSAVELIRVLNYADTTGRGFINMNLNNNGAGGIITQASSGGKIAYQTLDNVAIGSVTPSTGVFTKVNSGTFIKSAAIGATVDLLSIGTYASVVSLSMTIIATSTGASTARKYQIVLMGNGTATGSDVSFISEVYAGGGTTFSLIETTNSPVAGTNKLSISNTSGVASTYRVTYTVEDLTGTLTLL